EIKLRNEDINTPYYHYTHGLKKHDGNCQRIAHGHRSKIDIFTNGQYNQELVQQWANRWQDIYLASNADLVNQSDLSFVVVNDGYEKLCTAYQAPQGYFELAMPIKRAEVLPDDTTVEQLSRFICQQLKQQTGKNEVTVYAYEGIGKGAIFEL
ncbi:MAG: 6-carboxytetrahydropterin synthase, partial [Psychromonas sp.]